MLDPVGEDSSAASVPRIFYLLKDEYQGTAEERLDMLAMITLKERPALVIRAKQLKRNVRVVWGI